MWLTASPRWSKPSAACRQCASRMSLSATSRSNWVMPTPRSSNAKTRAAPGVSNGHNPRQKNRLAHEPAPATSSNALSAPITPCCGVHLYKYLACYPRCSLSHTQLCTPMVGEYISYLRGLPQPPRDRHPVCHDIGDSESLTKSYAKRLPSAHSLSRV